METMKAVQFHEFGGPDVLRIEEAAAPTPGDDEILVRVHAAGVNPVDAKMRQGSMKAIEKNLPLVAGLDFAGTVEKVGKNVQGFAVGDEVYGRPQFGHAGSYAERVVVKAGDIAKKPRSVDFAHAAAVPTPALAAWQALFESQGQETMGLKAGQTVLIHGAAGGVGTFAVQLAKWTGAKVVATARGDHAQYVKDLGADVVIDYEAQRFEVQAKDVDAVLDVVGGETQARSIEIVKKGGVLVSTVGVTQEVEARAKARGVRTVSLFAASVPRILQELADLIDDGALIVPVSEELPLERAQEAHERIQSGHTRGKIVLDVH